MNINKMPYIDLMNIYPNGKFITRNSFYGYYAKIKGQGNKLIAIFGIQK